MESKTLSVHMQCMCVCETLVVFLCTHDNSLIGMFKHHRLFPIVVFHSCSGLHAPCLFFKFDELLVGVGAHEGKER